MTDGGRGRLGSGLETCGPASPWDWDTLVTIYYLPLCLKLSRKHTLRRYFLSPYYDTHLVWSLLLIVFTAHISPVCYAGRPPRLCCKVLTALLWPGEEERCSMKTPHIHRLASLASTAPDTAAGHMTYLTHARVPSGFSRHWWLPSQFPCTECTAALQHCRLVRGVQVHGVQTVAFIMCSSAEIISDINHAITSTQHRPGTSRHSARITQILSENMLREA